MRLHLRGWPCTMAFLDATCQHLSVPFKTANELCSKPLVMIPGLQLSTRIVGLVCATLVSAEHLEVKQHQYPE